MSPRIVQTFSLSLPTESLLTIVTIDCGTVNSRTTQDGITTAALGGFLLERRK